MGCGGLGLGFLFWFVWGFFGLCVLCYLSSWDGMILSSTSYLAGVGWAFPHSSVG